MSVADAAPLATEEPIELEAAELAMLLCALRLDALAARALAGTAGELERRRRLEQRVADADGLRRVVARACGPIAATATLALPPGARQALVEVLERLEQRIAAGHAWGHSYATQHPVDATQLAGRLVASCPGGRP